MNEADHLDWCRSQLVAAAQLLAVGPEGHAVALPAFVHIPDELLLVYDDAFPFSARLHEAGLISEEAYRRAVALDATLRALPVAHDYESALAAIATSPAWATVREEAAGLVMALGARVEPPALGGSYVQ